MKIKTTLILTFLSSFYLQAENFDCNQNNIPIQECETLKEFYYQTDGENWADKDTNLWWSDNNPCGWTGVICKNNSVSRLERVNVNLNGNIPNLSNLKNLTQLALFNNNNLKGSIPELRYNNKLEKIVLFNSSLSGFIPDVSSLSFLTDLVLHNNDLIGVIPEINNVTNLTLSGNDLCLSPKLNYSSMNYLFEEYDYCKPMFNNDIKGYINLSEYGVVPDDNRNDDEQINYILGLFNLSLSSNDVFNNLEIFIPKGIYNVQKSIYIKDFENLTIKGEIANDYSTKFLKSNNFGNNSNFLIDKAEEGSIFIFSFGNNINLKNIVLEGQTPKEVSYNWWDHGVSFSSVKNVNVFSNSFYNFGDSALRIVTDPDSQSGTIECQYINVLNNYFENITQTSTTSKKGGCKNYNFSGNTLKYLKGAVKFATRVNGAKSVLISNNNISVAGDDLGYEHNNGIEIEGYSNVDISNNIIKNGYLGNGIVVRQPHKSYNGAFDWSNINIYDNHIIDFKKGIYYSNLPLPDGSLSVSSNHIISNNIFESLNNNESIVAVQFVGTQYYKLKVINNEIIGIPYDIFYDSSQKEQIFKFNNIIK